MDLTREEYIAKKKEVISRFTKDFIEKNIDYDSTTNHVIECLIQDVNPYTIIEKLLELRIEDRERISKFLDYNAVPPLILKEK